MEGKLWLRSHGAAFGRWPKMSGPKWVAQNEWPKMSGPKWAALGVGTGPAPCRSAHTAWQQR